MATFWIRFALAAITLTFAGCADNESMPKNLVQRLMERQVSYLRPGAESNHPANVNFTINVIDIVEVNEKAGYMALYGWFRLQWTDARLSWNPDEFSNLQSLTLPANKLWNPGIQLYNSADHSMMSMVDAHAMVNYTGRVWITTPVTLKARCAFYMYYFPYDEQTCDFRLGSWSYTASQVNLSRPHVERNPDSENHYEWLIVDITPRLQSTIYPCCPDAYQDVTYSVRLRRRSDFLAYSYLEPVILLSGLLSLVFMLPVADEHRYVLSLGLLVSMTLSMGNLDWMFAGTEGTVPILGQYYVSIHILLAMAIVVSTAVTNMADRGNRGQFPPKCLRWIFIRVLGKVLCIPKVAYAQISSEEKPNTFEIIDPDDPHNPGSALNEWYRIALAMDRLSLVIFVLLVIGIFITFMAGISNG